MEARGAPVRLAGGSAHSLAIRQDGTVWAWGYNAYGQIGDGTATSRASPVQVSGLTGAVSVAAGTNYSLALKSDGTVWGWGYNRYGNLGDNTTTNRSTPVQVLSLSGVISIASSIYNYQSFAVKSDGTVWAWGYNGDGALGDNSTTVRYTPVQVKQSVGGVVSALTDVVAIDAGVNHTLALKSNGTVWAWGSNASGQIGNGTLANQLAAVQVVNLFDAVAISAGTDYSLALKADGTVVAWGVNTNGQLGTGSTTNSASPLSVSGLNNIKSISAGGFHSIALKSDGTAAAWGRNTYGQLGNGSTTNALVPVPVSNVTGATAISAGYYHSHASSGANGVIWGWGYNANGEVGDNSGANRSVPVVTLLTSGIQGVAGGDQHSLYVKWDGTVWAWGANTYGTLGDGTPLRRLTPVPVKGPSGTGTLSGIVAVAAGTNYSLALASNGTVYAWGQNYYGQLGDGTTTNRNLPSQVPGVSGIVAIAAGATHALALRFDGKVYAWGRNHLGQLGDEAVLDRVHATQVHYLDNVVAIAAGASHSVAVQQNGTVYAWGSGSDGQLCDSNAGTDYFSPVISQIPNIVGGVSVAAGTSHTLLLDVAGKAWGCGDNQYGQLGDGTTVDRSEPTAILLAGAGNSVRLVAGGNTSALVSTIGTVYAWGHNGHGQLGDGTTVSKSLTTQVPSFAEVSGVAGGTTHLLAVKTNGSVYAWGRNNAGQIGDSSLTNRLSPTAALLP
ncbi:RCC1 repeat-containing protein [Stigmatella sp. ncwal1]|uniref:RCC1 repeat-containing protein n=1 Tax=Stigmatella ashevillensis TaxID=2995309 RepID=A0ABT5DDQ7_9BACT|nr:RCC1 domain-containing protein [Stigmatella ashevillena]MDC0711776.1 RCC1 repeat-containing protein [Stigmatella ashevillena]